MTSNAKEYAVALFSLACEGGNERAIYDALARARDALYKEPDYIDLLSSPALGLDERLGSLSLVFGDSLPEHVFSLLALLCEKHRIGELDACAAEYLRLLDAKEAFAVARVTSAVALTESEQAALKKKLEKMSGKTVSLSAHIDPDILGGVIVEMGDTVIDGSLRHRLREIKDVMNQ
jgi:F-type H+-transporting ATPase subunit delta